MEVLVGRAREAGWGVSTLKAAENFIAILGPTTALEVERGIVLKIPWTLANNPMPDLLAGPFIDAWSFLEDLREVARLYQHQPSVFYRANRIYRRALRVHRGQSDTALRCAPRATYQASLDPSTVVFHAPPAGGVQ